METRFREFTLPGPGTSVINMGVTRDIRVSDGKELRSDVQTGQLTPSVSGASEYSRCWDTNHGRPPYRRGDAFLMVRYMRPSNFISTPKLLVSLCAGLYPTNYGRVERWYTGALFDPFMPTSIVSNGQLVINEAFSINDKTVSTTSLLEDISSLGNRAYARLRPKVEKAGITQALVELREAPDMLRTTAGAFVRQYKNLAGQINFNLPNRRLNDAAANEVFKSFMNSSSAKKRLGEQYLNFKFGWVPFVKDVVQVCDVVVNGDTYIARESARNGKWRSRYFAEDEISNETVIFSDSTHSRVDPGVLDQSLTIGGKVSYTVTLEDYQRVWYEGSFKSYRAEFDARVPMHPGVRKVRQYASLLGANISPTVLWKVTPWTWLSDYFVNIGDAIQRTEDFISNSVVNQYVYVMRHKKQRYRCRLVYTDLNGTTIDQSWYFGAEVKQRGVGSGPFGFSFPPGGLSGQQLAILAALGLSKWG